LVETRPYLQNLRPQFACFSALQMPFLGKPLPTR
jgi:hypothetical protein